MAGIGETLRAARRAQGRSIADAAAETRVRESYLAALEAEDFASLGGDVYVRGFIRLYARYLGVDGEELVDEYRATHERPEAITAIPGADVHDMFSPLNRRRVPGGRPVFIAVAGVLVLAVLWTLGRQVGGGAGDASEEMTAAGPEPAQVPDAPVPDLLATQPAPASEETPGGVVAATAGEALGPLTVEIVPQRQVRVDVIQGQPPVHATLENGESREITGTDAVVVTLSDATAAQLLVNGQALPALGEDGAAVEVTCRAGAQECEVRDV